MPQVVPLGNDMALVALGAWDEETATLVLPAFPDAPEDEDRPKP